MLRTFTLLLTLILPFPLYASGLVLDPGTPYYFDRFDPDQRPWVPGQPLNFEEIFKNYEYYEVILDGDGQGLRVNHFVRGSKASSEHFKRMPDGALQADNPPVSK